MNAHVRCDLVLPRFRSKRELRAWAEQVTDEQIVALLECDDVSDDEHRKIERVVESVQQEFEQELRHQPVLA